MDTMGPLGQARLTMGLFGRLEAHYEHYSMGPLGQVRPTMDTIGPLEPWNKLGSLWTLWVPCSFGTG